jgi:hypothetical protein
MITLLLSATTAKAQSIQEVFSNAGIWQDYGIPVSAKEHPEFNGRLVNYSWKDIETSPDVWDWTGFDNDLKDHSADNMPVIFMIYTRMNAPDWLFLNGVPKVNELNSSGELTGYSPYYLDAEYNFYFKRMITKVREHIQSLEPSLRNQIIGVQPCFGSTGDQIAYKGTVAKQYEITDAQFDSLFKVYSLYYYNEYKDLSPKITMLSNPNAQQADQQYWLASNCPGGWTKCGIMSKGSQLNMESDKNNWLYDILNKPWNGKYIKSRSEIVGQQLYAGWWSKNKYKEMFATMCYCIYWGVDWPNETSDILQDPKFDSSLSFFNKYAGQKVPGLAQNALCALKDVLDASDSERFPASNYGVVDRNNKTRYSNIYNSFIPYGAQLQDISAVTGTEYDCLGAKGTNDVGWHLLPGNYERFLHQIDANSTSAGYWNIDSENPDVMFGRFGRGFDIAKGKNALYFDVDDAFLKNAPLNGAYPVTIEVTYYDKGTGSWQLCYNTKNNPDRHCPKIICTDTKTWKKATFVLSHARFDNHAERNSDFFIKNTGTSNVIFSTVELSRAEQPSADFITTPLTSFDTVCQNASVRPNSFVLNAASLNGTKVQVGPLKGFSFSSSEDGVFTNSLNFTNYNTAINSTIYVKINTNDTGYFAGNIPIKGGGLNPGYVAVKGTVLNTSPALNAKANIISCYNRKDGTISLNPQGGIGPFTYTWTNDVQQFWNRTTQNLDSLNVANYTVVVNSFAGCSISKTFNITQPDVLVTSVSPDSAIVCKGGLTTVTVSAIGGTQPYTGAGSFTASAGFKTYTVTDKNGCSDPQGYTVVNGTVSSPTKPLDINGSFIINSQQTNLIYSVQSPNNAYTYSWSVPSDATIISGQHTSSVTVNWGSTAGYITVQAQNNCGMSAVLSKMVKISKSLNAFAITLPQAGKEEILLMPNPVKNIATLKFYAKINYSYTIQISDMRGRLLLQKKGTAAAGANTEKFNVQHLAAGTYFILFSNNTGERQTLEMIKE